MNRREADSLGREASQNFIGAFDQLLSDGYYDNARAMIMSTYPFAIATLKPEMRCTALADLIDIFYRVGSGVFEDSDDLYDHLTVRRESLE